ncbi:MAG: acyl-CoA dehydrogenase family protein [Promethearchaeota archaeon]
MDFSLTPEQEMIKNMVKEFAEKELAPIADKIDKEEMYPAEAVKKMGQLNLLGMTVPPEYGGAGTDSVSYLLAVEEISKVSASVSVVMSVNNSLVCEPLNMFGTEDQKQKFLKPLAQGAKLGVFALTEANAGSDPTAIQTKATLDGNEYVISGNKLFVSQGSEADTVIVFARTSKGEKPHKGISAFIVEKGTPGFSVGSLEEKLGIRGSPTAELVFEECRVPKENLLGEEGEGFKLAMKSIDNVRMGVAAQAVGIAQAALDKTIEYAKQRVQFGKTISNFQYIQFTLAELATEIEAARLLALRAAVLKDQNKKFTKEVAMAKFFASETAVRTARMAVQIHGGYGYTREFPVERFLRDSLITSIYGGTSEIQRLVIAKRLLKG